MECSTCLALGYSGELDIVKAVPVRQKSETFRPGLRVEVSHKKRRERFLLLSLGYLTADEPQLCAPRRLARDIEVSVEHPDAPLADLHLGDRAYSREYPRER